MRGLILTGPLGVGKSTAQRSLVLDHGFWTPETITTRLVDDGEVGMGHRTPGTFVKQVRSGELVLPTRFGSQWYAWTKRDVAMISRASGRAVLNVRPSTALTIAGLMPSFIPVWLWASEEVLAARRTSRALARDLDQDFRLIREAADQEDRAYEPLFARRAEADPSLIPRLVAMLTL